MIGRRSLIAVWLCPLALLLLASALLGADPQPPLRYRRVFVPQAEIDQQIRGLLPLARDEFERRIGQAAASQLAQAPDVHIEQATYRARVQGNSLVGGRAELTFTSRREAPALFAFGPSNLAISDAAWRDSPARPAQLGNTPGGQLACVVPRSGVLGFDWTLAGEQDQRGALTFRLQLPPAPIKRLEIELPKSAELTVEQGLARRAGTAGGNLWLVDAGPAADITLRVTQPSPQTPGEPLVLVHQNTVYSVHRATMDVETTLKLDVLAQPLAELVLSLDEPLQLTQVRIGDQLLRAVQLPPREGQRRVVVHLPQPLTGEGNVVQLSGVLTWPGSGRQRLPAIRSEGGTWQSGRATVSAPAALQLEATAQGGGWQTAFSPASPARLQEEWQFQYYLPDAAVDIEPSSAAAPLMEASAVALDVQASQIQATMTAELSVVTAPRFDVEAEIPRAWIVDAIEVQPADMLEDRTLQTRGAGPQVLRLALRRPIAVGRPLTIIVRAHRRRPAAGQPLPADFALVARFLTVRDASRLVAVRSSDPATQVVVSGDEELRRVEPEQLSASQLRLFEGPPGPLVYAWDQLADPLQIRLAPASPRYRADAFVRAELEPDRLRQLCRLRITPEESLLESVTVRIAPPPAVPIRWSLAGEDARELTAHSLQPAGQIHDEALFELRLQRPKRVAFDIVAEFSAPVDGAATIPLVSVPAASSQSGLAEVHAAGGMPVSINAPQLQALPPLDRRVAVVASLRGVYRYVPGRAGSLEVTPVPAGRALAATWIDSLEATSWFSAEGSGDHEVRLVVHHPGRSPLAFKLSPSAASLRVTIDGEPLRGRLHGSASAGYVVPLRTEAETASVLLTYNSPPPTDGWSLWGRRITAELPQIELPVLASSWRVRLAPGWELLGEHPAQAADSASIEPLAGWTNYAVPYSPSSEAGVHLELIQPAVIRLWGWCLALAAAVVVLWTAPSLARLIGAAGLAGAAGLLVPFQFAPLLEGMLVGLVIGGAMWLLRPVANSSPVRIADSSRRTASSLAPRPALLLLILSLVLTLRGRAAPVEQQDAGPAPALRRVVIPMDDNRRPVGDYVFLEPGLYDALLQLTSREPGGLPDWLLEGAVYRPLVVPSDSPSVAELSAEFDIETFRGGGTVELELERKQIHLIEGRARLDGKPILTEWSAQGRLTFSVPTAGRHRLELVFGPAGPTADGVLCDLTIPRIAGSRLLLAGDADAIQVIGAQGAETRGPGGQRVVQLGPAARLTLRTLDQLPAAATALVQADQLVVWKVQPGSVTADARFRVRPVGGQVAELAIDLDPRLRLLRLPAGQSIAREWTEPTPRGSRLHLSLDKPASAEMLIQASFVWTGATGIGTFALPEIAIQADKREQNWAAIALATGLTWKTAPAPDSSDPALAELATAWGEALPEGAIALDMSRRPALLLATDPEPSRVKATQSLVCGVSLRSVQVRYEARLENVPPHALQHRIRVPANIDVRQVEVLEGERLVRSQWREVDGDALVIQLTQPPPGTLQIELRGHAPVGRLPSSVPLPVIQYQGAADDELLVRVYRQAGVQVDVPEGKARWQRRPDPELGRHRDGLGRLVARFKWAGGQPLVGPPIAVSASQSELRGVVVCRLVPEEPAWQLDVQCLLSVQAGLLETLRFELPPVVTGPVEVLPAAEYESISTTGEAGQRLLIRPQQAIDGSLRLAIRAPLRTGVDEAAIPLATTLLDAPQVRRLVALPRRGGQRRFEWQTSGLQAIDPATLDLPVGMLPAEYEVFEAVAERPAATAAIHNPTSAVARVLLAEHELTIGEAGRVSARSTFDVAPGGARQFVLTMPPGTRLVQASVESVPAQIVSQGAGQWLLQAASHQLPQRIEVVYESLLAGSNAANESKVQLPQLAGTKTEHSLWSIADGKARAVLPDAGPLGDDPGNYSALRLESIAAGIEALSFAPGRDLPPAVMLESLATWHKRFRAARAALDTKEQPSLAARTIAAEQQVERALVRLTEAGLSLPPQPDDDAVAATPRERLYAAAPGSQASVQIAAPAPVSRWSDARLAWSIAIALAGLIAAWRLAARSVQTWLLWHAHFTVAVLGVCLLVAGIVPWVGAVVLALAIWRSLHSPWPRSSSKVHSTVLRRQP